MHPDIAVLQHKCACQATLPQMCLPSNFTADVLAKQLHRRCACQATFGTSSDRDTLNTVDKQLSTSSYSCCLSIFRHSLLLTHLIIFVYHFFTILTFEHASLLSLFSNPISCEIDAILIYWGNSENAWHEGTCTQ